MKRKQVKTMILSIVAIYSLPPLSHAEESFTTNTIKEYVSKLDNWSKQELIHLNKGKKVEEKGNDIEGLIEAKESLLKKCNRIPWYVGTQMKDKPYKIAREFFYLSMEFYNNSKKFIEKKDKAVRERALNQFNASRKLLEKDIVEELMKLQK